MFCGLPHVRGPEYIRVVLNHIPRSRINVILSVCFLDQVGVLVIPPITHRMATAGVVGIPSSASSQVRNLDEKSREASDVNLHFWVSAVCGMSLETVESTLLLLQ